MRVERKLRSLRERNQIDLNILFIKRQAPGLTHLGKCPTKYLIFDRRHTAVETI